MTLAHITLSSGRQLELTELRMTSTYGGMLEGYPFRRLNDLKISGLAQNAAKAFPSLPVHLVKPRREYPDDTVGAFGPVELLPAVTCLGVFSSMPVDSEHNSALYYSALAVVWFQARPELPGEDRADPVLGSLAWEELARDFER